MKTKTHTSKNSHQADNIDSSAHIIGLDLGDKKHNYCVLDARGTVLKEDRVVNERVAMSRLAQSHPGATVVMEACTHSPWVSRFFKELGCKVIVANPRKVRAIYQNERKCDERDAEMLARIARLDAKLLCPVEHGGQEAQQHLLSIKLRDALVRSRMDLINVVRFTLKSLGHAVSNPSAERFHKSVAQEVPAECLPVITPLLGVLENIALQIKELDRAISQLARERYPQAQKLQQIAGVGPITSLYFVLKVGDVSRFGRGRDIGAYLGLCPRRDQSGSSDRQLGISKCGDRYMRRLLVSAACYILGPFGPPCALRSYGQRLAGSGSMRDRKRATVAVARKLAVLMLSLWKNGTDYECRAPSTPCELIIERPQRGAVQMN